MLHDGSVFTECQATTNHERNVHFGTVKSRSSLFTVADRLEHRREMRLVWAGLASPKQGVRLWPRISRLLLSEGQREAEGELAPLGVLAPQRCRRFSYPAHAVSSTRTRSSPAPSVTHLCPDPAPLRPGPAASACSACTPYVNTSRRG
jgi:hypothetical protein